jgi:hypothetical protein
MNKIINNTKTIIRIGVFTILLIVWALSPLWVNPCLSTHLSEEEIDEIRTQPSWETLSFEQQSQQEQRYREREIPCGAEDLSTREKLEASRFQGLILDELRGLRPIILRIKLERISDPPVTYYFKGYTFFFIPAFEGFGGGSGYMEITPFPFLHGSK